MMMVESGDWTNFNCEKRNAFVCQRMPDTSVKELQKLVLEIKDKMEQNEKKLNKTSEDLETSKKELEKTNKELIQVKVEQTKLKVPIGFIYFQLSNQLEPQTMFPNTEWSDISYQYAGLFFRTLGGLSAPFGKEQEDASPRITGINVFCREDLSRKFNSLPIFNQNSNGVIKTADIYTGDDVFDGNVKHLQERHLTLNLSMSEVRPKNTAIKIWRRVK